MNKNINIVVIITFSLLTKVSGALIVENFNDYGSSSVPLTLGTSGSGWAGAWNHTGTGPNYTQGGLTFSSSGYSNAGNDSDLNDGLASYGSGGANNFATRSFSTGLTGTIWLSAVAEWTNPTAQVKLMLGSSANNFIGFFENSGFVGYDGTTNTTGSFSASITHLMLARIQIDASGNNDSVEYWINPNLTGGEAGLGASDFSQNGSDVFGSSLDGVGLAFRRAGSTFDALRISNEVTGFSDVTAVPEPSTYILLVFGTVIVFIHVRRLKSNKQTRSLGDIG
ncbi:MAG: PEP-CTERM sorting domain-containing protein [Verrucomicrobiota bacterium]